MLILTRRIGEVLMIGENIEIAILGITKRQVRIGINAPTHVEIHREEIFEKIHGRKSTILDVEGEEGAE